MSSMAGLPGFRLILSDELVEGGQRVGTFSPRPLSIEQVVSLLCQHFAFKDLCKERAIDPDKLGGGNGLHVVGFDGPRRAPIHNDKQLVDFLANPRNTRLPSVEVQLVVASPVKGKATPMPHGRDPRDRIEELEDHKFKLLRVTDQLERRLDDLDRRLERSREEAKRNLGIAVREINDTQEKNKKELQVQIDALVEADEATLRDLDVVRKHSFKVEHDRKKGDEELHLMIEQLGRRTEKQFEEVVAEQERQREVDDKLQQQITANLLATQAELLKHSEELERLEAVKVDVDLWRRTEEEMEERNQKEFADLRQKLVDAENRLRAELHQAEARLTEAISRVNKELHENVIRIDDGLRKLNEDLEAGLKAAAEALEVAREELHNTITDKVRKLEENTEEQFSLVREDIRTKDKNINNRVDELTARTAKTFQELNDRVEEMIRVERARLGTIEKDLAESTAKIRTDFRTEIERVRSDYEQEAARLDMDLSDLHMKHDVTKQEINFFQSRLADQKDWTQRQLTETATATRAVQVDAQEGLAAATKMLHALRDDAVGFREKMAKYISRLQHSSDSHGDAINSLEMQRGRMRSELDALIGDHKEYTGDMDGWANDVRVKVERLFRALEPPRVEWRIARAAQRAKELKKPLAVKSPPFSLRGLREVQMEFFPDGHNNSPEGKGILRLFMPPNGAVRFQCWVGKSTEGAHEYKPGNGLSVDILVEEWKDQIHEDGSVYVVMEVLRDLNNDDESLS
eukprot:CAMPEP_0179017880 /NCGR_PEP_ID=MMETSP0796-20121207/4067_1 /TAXON_ID=73915 /ORGANISM="Pyrodinium bahamense, Strain pbaha01" /LENGTH=746 /DNA_ID=CAMNT_0020713623 /DNA_START=38 /DNA_END=2275 /DNA_ORIENTATION=+